MKNIFNKIRRVVFDWLIEKLYKSCLLSDKQFLTLTFRNRTGYRMDWNNPKTFAEKMQWLKLYNRNPEYTVMADKVKVKKWVAERIGQEYIIPTLGVWERADDVDFDTLPNKFVIKCNHNSGLGMYICKDRTKMDAENVRKELRKGLRQDYFKTSGEWPYKDIPRRIIAEQFIEDDGDKDLADYKFFCFDGKPKYCQVIKDRSTKETIDFYDMDWKLQEFIGFNENAVNSKGVERPVNFDKMKEITASLSKGMPFARVDLYDVKGKIHFGEITFFAAAGFGKLRPDKYNRILGDMINLSAVKSAN